MTKEELIREFNALQIPGMDTVESLHELPGHFINLEYTLPSGQIIKLWDDNKTYWGNQMCKKNSERCYGLTTDGRTLLVCEYGDNGADAEIVVYKRL